MPLTASITCMLPPIDRRRFLSMFAVAGAVAAAAPLIPNARVWSFPSILERLFRWRTTDAGVLAPAEFVVTGGGNEFINVEWITRETLEQLKNHLSFANIAAEQAAWNRQPLRLGTTVQVRIPQRFNVGDRISIAGVVQPRFPATPIYPRKRAYFR